MDVSGTDLQAVAPRRVFADGLPGCGGAQRGNQIDARAVMRPAGPRGQGAPASVSLARGAAAAAPPRPCFLRSQTIQQVVGQHRAHGVEEQLFGQGQRVSVLLGIVLIWRG